MGPFVAAVGDSGGRFCETIGKSEGNAGFRIPVRWESKVTAFGMISMVKGKKSRQTNAGELDVLSARMDLEKKMGQIGKLLAEKNFSSEKEMENRLF